MFSSFCSKDNKNTNSIYNDNKNSTVVLNDKNKNAYKKNKIKINVENIINSELNSSIYINKYKANLLENKEKEMNKNKKINNINKKKENESFIDIQIPLVPEENIQVISLVLIVLNT